MKIINIQGRKKTGKTTTVTNIIKELSKRGYSVGSIKSIHIDGFTMDSENEDTGKHKKAGADPVTAKCHDETNIMFRGKMDLDEILSHYNNEWVVIEGHVDLKCPNISTGRTLDMLDDRINEHTICFSGVVSSEGITSYKGVPVISAVADIKRLVDLIEEKTYEYVPSKDKKKDIKTGKSPEKKSPDEKKIGFSADITAPRSGKFQLTESSRYIRISKDTEDTEPGKDFMLIEHIIDIYVNEIKVGSVPHTPENIPELVLGWTLSEGYYKDPADIAGLEINDDGTVARISIKPLNRPPYALKNEIKAVKPIAWKKKWIFELAGQFENILPLRKETMAAHNCRIAKETQEGNLKVLFALEDIGRHSAIDKVIGRCIKNNIDMRDCVLFTSGRISRMMAEKVIRAGIPVMAGKGTISGKAVELAQKNNLTLIGYAKKDSCCLFTECIPPTQQK